MENLSHQATTQILFQQPSYHPLAQHSATLAQLPVQDLCSTYRDSLQVHRPSGLLAGSADSSLHSYTALQASLQPSAQTAHPNASCYAGDLRNRAQPLQFHGLW